MKYYARIVTRREAINRFGKLGFVPYVEMVKVNKESVIEDLNKGKRIRFAETPDKILISILRKGETGVVISIKEQEWKERKERSHV